MSDEIFLNEAAGEEPQAATESEAAPVAAEEPRVDQAQTESVEPVEAEVAEVAPAAAEAIAQDAPESTPAADVESSAVEPTDATAAASVAQDWPDVVEPEILHTEVDQVEVDHVEVDQVAVDQIGEGVYLGPDPLEPIVQKSELESRLAAEEAKAASLLLTNEALQGQLQSTLDSLTRSRDEFAQATAAVRADAVGLVDELAAEIERFRERARAVQAVSPGERVRVVLRDAAIVAGEAREAGETLAFISLATGVTLNFLVDAVRNRLAKGM